MQMEILIQIVGSVVAIALYFFRRSLPIAAVATTG